MQKINWSKINHFKQDNFMCPCGCGLNIINPQLVKTIDIVRDEYGYPIYLSSACRCAKHNLEIDGKKDSSHLLGYALDIKVYNSTDRYGLLPILFKYFKRIGVAHRFVHVDLDPEKDQKVLWTY